MNKLLFLFISMALLRATPGLSAPTCTRALLSQSEYSQILQTEWAQTLNLSYGQFRFKKNQDRESLLQNLQSLSKEEQVRLLDFIQSHYRDVQYYKQGHRPEDLPFRNTKKFFDHALSVLEGPELLIKATPEQFVPALKAYLVRQSQLSDAQDALVIQKIFESLRWLQTKLKAESQHRPELHGQSWAVLGSFVNGRGQKGVSDIDLNAYSNEMLELGRQLQSEFPGRKWDIDHLSVGNGTRFDLVVSTNQSPLVFRVSADQVVLEIYEPNSVTPARHIDLSEVLATTSRPVSN